MTVTPITHAPSARAKPEEIPPGHWIAASRRAGHPIPADQLPDPDCRQCKARKATSTATSQEVQP